MIVSIVQNSESSEMKKVTHSLFSILSSTIYSLYLCTRNRCDTLSFLMSYLCPLCWNDGAHFPIYLVGPL